RPDRLEVLVPGRGVEGDQDVDLVRARHVTFRGDPELVPGRQAFDVGGEDVFGRDRDAHPEDRPGQDQVGRLASGTVDGRCLDCEVVDYLFGQFVLGPADYGFYATVGPNLDSVRVLNL